VSVEEAEEPMERGNEQSEASRNKNRKKQGSV